MRGWGCSLSILGLILCVLSLTLFSRSIWRALQARCAHAQAIELGKDTTTEVIAVDVGRSCQIAVEIDVQSDSVDEDRKGGETAYKLRYNFPLVYTVRDAEGNALGRFTGAARWDQGLRITRGEPDIGATGGTARIQHNFAKFDPPPSGKIKVDTRVMPDTEYGAKARSVELKVYDNVTRHARSLLSASLFVMIGPILMVIGLVLFIIGAVMKGDEAPAD